MIDPEIKNYIDEKLMSQIHDGNLAQQIIFQNLFGNIATVTSVPTYIPNSISEQVVIYNGALYYYNFLDGVWYNASSGSGSPGGSNTQVQFNNSGSFGGSADFTFDDGTDVAVIGGSTGGALQIQGPLSVSKGAATSSFFEMIDTGYLTVRQFHVDTTDATPTIIAQVFPTSATLLYFQIFGERTGGTSGTLGDSAGYVRTAMYKFTTVPVLVGSVQDTFTAESQAGWDITFAAGVTDVQVKVTGAANNNISWRALMYAYSDVGT